MVRKQCMQPRQRVDILEPLVLARRGIPLVVAFRVDSDEQVHDVLCLAVRGSRFAVRGSRLAARGSRLGWQALNLNSLNPLEPLEPPEPSPDPLSILIRIPQRD